MKILIYIYLSLSKSPLFPGFYKSIYLKDPKAIAAVQSLLDRRQPYVGIFLATDHDSDMDIISAAQQISSVGVFAQITNVYQSGPDNNALTIVVYPHRRIKLESVVLTSPGTTTASSSSDQVKASSTSSTSTATSTSPEEVVSVVEGEDPTPPSPPPSPPLSPSSPSSSSSSSPILPVNAHLNTLTSPVGLLNVTNLIDEKATPNDTYIKALTSEILNVLKEISGVNPIIRDQVVQFSIQTGGDAFTDPAKLADFAAALCQGEPTELQGVIECLNLRERLDRALLVLKKELANTNLQKQVRNEMFIL